MTRSPRSVSDRGGGLIGSVAGLLVVLLLLTFSVQILLGLYTTTVLRATLHDAASRAANQGTAATGDVLDEIERGSTASLGDMGDRATVSLRAVDVDGDGGVDVIAGEAVAVPPRLVPVSFTRVVRFDRIRVGVRVRVERAR